jgi:hypothetical protein
MLTMRDVDMPQCGSNDIEGAYVPFLQLVILAESLPTLSEKVTNFSVCQTAHLP